MYFFFWLIYILSNPSADDVDAAEDRERFDEILEKCHIDRPRGSTVFTSEEAITICSMIPGINTPSQSHIASTSTSFPD